MATTAAAMKDTVVGLLAAVMLSLPLTAGAQPPVQVQSRDGASSISFGLLTQAMAQRDFSDNGPSTHDICFRRFRLIGGGKLANKVKLFVDSDTPYMGEHNAPKISHTNLTFAPLIPVEFKLVHHFVASPRIVRKILEQALPLQQTPIPHSFD